MHTLAIVSTKGGVGKTTLAVHLAVAAQTAGVKTLLIDLDPQGSAAQWSKDRARLASEHGRWFKAPLDVRRLFANDLAEEILRAEGEGYGLVIIDTPPHADFPAARAAEAADIVLMPSRPGYFDLHAAKATVTLVRDIKAHAFFVMNQVPHNSPQIAGDAAAFLEGKGIRQAPVTITLLQPYVRALRDGLTAPELVPDGRHAQEIGALWSWLEGEFAAVPAKARVAPEQVAAPKAILGDPFAGMLATLPDEVA
jgi:chromosome partitioning protein